MIIDSRISVYIYIISTVDGKILHPLFRHVVYPINELGFQPSFWWCRISSTNRRCQVDKVYMIYLSIYVYIYIYMYMYIYVYVYIYICIYMYIYIWWWWWWWWWWYDVYTHTYIHIYTYIYICINKTNIIMYTWYTEQTSRGWNSWMT